jgi:uncharacterized protein GlcG (DUF336 family)
MTRTNRIWTGGLVLTVAAAFGVPLVAQQQRQPARDQDARLAAAGDVANPNDISLDQAHAALEAAAKKAQEINTKMDICVVDAGGNLKAFARMDGAWLGSIDISIKKAKTARYFDMPTGEIGKLSQPGKPLYQIEVSNGGLITFPGGVPIKNAQGTVIGAIGVSGSTVENDHTVADAGAQAALSGARGVTGRTR